MIKNMKIQKLNILCDYGCGLKANYKFKNGTNCCSKYHASCPALKKKAKDGILKSWTNERKEAASKRTKKQWQETNTLNSDKVNKKRSKSLKQVWKCEKRRENNRKKNQQYWNQPHIKKKRKIQSKELFKDHKYVEKWKEGLNAHPNECEIKISDLLNEILPGEYQFTGGFTFWVDMINPDFVCKKKKKVIEFFGVYWHKEEDIKTRGDIFRNNGYDPLFIWETELGDLEQIKNKIIEFHGR